MPRDIPASIRQGILKNALSNGLLPLLVVTSNDGVKVETMRLVRSDRAVISNGETYLPMAFELAYADQDPDDEQPNLEITIDGVDPTIRYSVRKVVEPPTIRLILVELENVDSVVRDITGRLRQLVTTGTRLQGKVELYEDLGRIQFPALKFTRAFGFKSLRP